MKLSLQKIPVFFFHFHKAAGSFVTESFLSNGYKTPRWIRYDNSLRKELRPHLNGNIYSRDISLPENNINEFSDVRPSEVRWHEVEYSEQVKRLKQEKYFKNNYLASEWDFPQLSALREALPEYKTMTVLRDPFNRFLSNYYYDVMDVGFRERNKLENNQIMTIDDYLQTKDEPQTSSNFYIKTILGLTSSMRNSINEEQYEKAKSFVRSLDYVVILENGNLNATLKKINIVPFVNNKVNSSQKINIEEKALNTLKENFAEQNSWDYKLYKYAKTMHNVNNL